MIFITIFRLILYFSIIRKGYFARQKFTLTQTNNENEESFICDGRHYREYDAALRCFKRKGGTTFFIANMFINGVKTTIFYGKGKSFRWDLMWKSNSWNNNQWSVNNVHRNIVSKGNPGKPIVSPTEEPRDDIKKLDKYNMSIVKLRLHYVAETNKYRMQHGIANLTVNPIIEKRAQLWAEKLVKKKMCNNKYNLCHEGDKTYGENIAMTTYQFPKYIIAIWYNEMKHFNFKTYKLHPSAYHFTQLLWKGSKEVGCGISRNKKYMYYVVCKYYPPGNVNGMVRHNVSPLREK